MGVKHRIARKAVTDARKSGTLPAPRTLTCAICEDNQASSYHHWHGYKPGFEMDVIPVCAECHRIADRNVQEDATIADVQRFHAISAKYPGDVPLDTAPSSQRRKTEYIDVRSTLAEMNAQKPLRDIASQVGLDTSDIAEMSRIIRGQSVSTRVLLRIGRKLGCIEPPRKLFRPVCSKEEWEQFQRWKAGR